MPTLVEFGVFVLVGLFGVNGVPHFVQGVVGNEHMTPLGSDSSAVTNVVWGSVNFAVAGLAAWWASDAIAPETVAVAFVSGVALAVALAWFWSRPDAALPWE